MPTSPYPKKLFSNFSDGTPGIWYEILPNLTTYPQPWPAVIMGYAGGFKNGTALQANLIAAALTLAAVGIACLSVFSRSDRKLIPGQTSPAFFPSQTDDYKRAVIAVRKDTRFDPLRIGGVAASSGAASVFGCASEIMPSDCPNCVGWGPADRLKAFVGMSGPFQYDDRTPYTYLKPFVQDVTIYCQSSDLGRQNTCSPTHLMDSGRRTGNPATLAIQRNHRQVQ